MAGEARRSRKRLAMVSLALLLVGCAGRSTRPLATDVPPERAEPAFWLDQPTDSRVVAGDYDRLWFACDSALRKHLFTVDRLDYRQGVLTSRPLVSKHWAEFWRPDVQTGDDLARSSLATYRRTVRCDVKPTEAGRFIAEVRVVVERSAAVERRVTTAIQYRDTFGPNPAGAEFTADDGTPIAAQYWYAVARDPALEQSIAEAINAALKK